MAVGLISEEEQRRLLKWLKLHASLNDLMHSWCLSRSMSCGLTWKVFFIMKTLTRIAPLPTGSCSCWETYSAEINCPATYVRTIEFSKLAKLRQNYGNSHLPPTLIESLKYHTNAQLCRMYHTKWAFRLKMSFSYRREARNAQKCETLPASV